MVALWNDVVRRKWRVVQQTLYILSKSFCCGKRECGIVPDVPDIVHVIIVIGVKLATGNDFQDEDVPGNHRQVGIIDMDVHIFAILTTIATGSNSSEWVSQISTAQK